MNTVSKVGKFYTPNKTFKIPFDTKISSLVCKNSFTLQKCERKQKIEPETFVWRQNIEFVA